MVTSLCGLRARQLFLQVGDNAASWAYDGARQLKWHAGKSEAYGDAWQQGDVVRLPLTWTSLTDPLPSILMPDFHSHHT